MSSYDVPGEDFPDVKCSARAALELRDAEIGGNRILELMQAVDSYIPQPARPKDKPFLMPIEDVFSISGRGTVVTALVERGLVKVGDEIELVGIQSTEKRPRAAVEVFRTPLALAEGGDNREAWIRR